MTPPDAMTEETSEPKQPTLLAPRGREPGRHTARNFRVSYGRLLTAGGGEKPWMVRLQAPIPLSSSDPVKNAAIAVSRSRTHLTPAEFPLTLRPGVQRPPRERRRPRVCRLTGQGSWRCGRRARPSVMHSPLPGREREPPIAPLHSRVSTPCL